MKFVIAPDSFKNCLRASAVCFHLAAGIRSSAPAAELLPLPLAEVSANTILKDQQNPDPVLYRGTLWR